KRHSTSAAVVSLPYLPRESATSNLQIRRPTTHHIQSSDPFTSPKAARVHTHLSLARAALNTALALSAQRSGQDTHRPWQPPSPGKTAVVSALLLPLTYKRCTPSTLPPYPIYMGGSEHQHGLSGPLTAGECRAHASHPGHTSIVINLRRPSGLKASHLRSPLPCGGTAVDISHTT
ncbi:unnamed protein product, partial [Ectocarpus fasciculatus]